MSERWMMIGWKDMEPLGTISVVKRSPFYTWCAKNVPYWPIPFITKRQRVRLRSYFRYHWRRKVDNRITDVLLRTMSSPLKFDYNVDTNDIDYWELIIDK